MRAAEEFADGAAEDSERAAACAALAPLMHAVGHTPSLTVAQGASHLGARNAWAATMAAHVARQRAGLVGVVWATAGGAEAAAEAVLLRDIFGNPYRAFVLSPSMLTPTILSLA